MARGARIYRNVETDMWMSDDFRSLSAPPPSGQGLWQYLLTGPRTIAIPGVVVARPAVMADDLRWSRRGFDKAMAEIVAAGMAEIDAEAGLVVLTKALIRDGKVRDTARPASPPAVKSWVTALLKLPACALRDVVAARVGLVMSLIGGAFPSVFAESMAESCTMTGAVHVPWIDAPMSHSGNREQGTEIPDVSHPGARGDVPATMPVLGAVPPPQAARGVDTHRLIADEIHARHAAEARRIAVDFPGTASTSIGGGLLSGDTLAAVLFAVGRWAAEARELGVETRDHVAGRMSHLVAVREATARRDGHMRWWAAGSFWRWTSVEIDLAQTPEQVQRGNRGRDGPRAPPRPGVGPAAPAAHHGIGTIDPKDL